MRIKIDTDITAQDVAAFLGRSLATGFVILFLKGLWDWFTN